MLQDALKTKITRERIGEEVDKMMKGMWFKRDGVTLSSNAASPKLLTGPNPLRAIQLIDHLALHRAIFAPPPSFSALTPLPESVPLHTALASSTILHHFLSPTSPDLLSTQSRFGSDIPPEAVAEPQGLVSPPSPSPFFERLHAPNPILLSGSLADSTTKRRLYLASALTPFRRLTYIEKKRTKLLVEACIREGLKVRIIHPLQCLDIIDTFLQLGIQNHYVDGIPALYTAADLIFQPKLEKLERPSPRVALGELNTVADFTRFPTSL